MTKANQVINESITFKNSQGLKARGTLLKLSQNYIIFEVYNPYSIVQLSEVLSEMSIVRAGKEIYNGKAVVTSIVNTGIVLIVSATLSDSCWKSTTDLNSKDVIKHEIQALISNFESQQEIDNDFKLIVESIRSFLSDIKNWLDKLEPLAENSKVKLNSDFMLKNFSELFSKLGELYRKFGNIADKFKSEELSFYKRFIRDNLHPFVMSSPFPHRMFSKPLGFAGDYEMMNMIQRENAEGPNLYAKFINVFHTNIPIADSVKNRTEMLIKKIEEGVKLAEKENREYHAFSIGCGPALEVRRFIEKNSPKVKCNFKLLDFNEETLNFASSGASKVINGKSFYIQTELNSVHELLKKSVNKEIEKQRYDFVYCSGLFDYLSDRVCSRLIKMFFDLLKPNGKVLVTNMHSNNNDHHMQELIFEWYLIYRDEKIMSALVPGLGKQQTLFTDSTGVNLCLEITN